MRIFEGQDGAWPVQVVDPVAAALVALQHWLTQLYSDGKAQYGHEGIDDGIVHLDNTVADRFVLGFLNNAALIAMPELEMEWVRTIPWHYAAIHRNKSDLHFVSEALDNQEVSVAQFAMSFSIESNAKSAQVKKHSEIDIRELVSPREHHLEVAITPLKTIPLYVLEDNEEVLDYTNRKRLAIGRGRY